MKCEFTGCGREAGWECRKLWDAAKGKNRTIYTCDEHKPDPANRPESLRHLPFFYDVRPLGKDTAANADA